MSPQAVEGLASVRRTLYHDIQATIRVQMWLPPEELAPSPSKRLVQLKPNLTLPPKSFEITR